MVRQYFVGEANDVLSFVVMDEVVVLERGYDVLFTYTSSFTNFAEGGNGETSDRWTKIKRKRNNN